MTIPAVFLAASYSHSSVINLATLLLKASNFQQSKTSASVLWYLSWTNRRIEPRRCVATRVLAHLSRCQLIYLIVRVFLTLSSTYTSNCMKSTCDAAGIYCEKDHWMSVVISIPAVPLTANYSCSSVISIVAQR